ncbi:MAG: endonuclease V, partial [Candidatus Latescibacteria bacterium]|nr:endonuclease V [Candidatus Latescibacterota bacterium]
HRWDVTPADARRIQARLRKKVRLTPLPPRPRTVAGADCAFSRDRETVAAVVVVFALPRLEVVERAEAFAPLGFPYVPGLLTFREGPALLAAFKKLEAAPDVALFDGQGYAHPHRLGLATHLGLWLETPTVGVAKSRLVGEAREVPERAGRYRTLYDAGEAVGRVVRTRDRTKPLYVSPGHLCDLDGAMRVTLRCGGGYRLPEPTRVADREVARLVGRGGRGPGTPRPRRSSPRTP